MGNQGVRLFQLEVLGKGTRYPPYLFLLCAEGLSATLRKNENGGIPCGIAVCRRAPLVSHLLLLMIVLYLAKLQRRRG